MTIRVLLIESDPVTVQHISEQLQQLECLVIGQGNDPTTALAQVQATQAELVIMNLSLRGSLEMVQQASCPVIYITPPNLDEEILAVAEATNPCGYLFTPVNPTHLRLSLQSALSHFRTQQQLQQSQTENLQTLQAREDTIQVLSNQVVQLTGEMRSFVDASLDHIFVINRDQMRIDYCNDIFAKTLYNTSRNEVEGKTIFECFTPTDAEYFAKQNQQVFDTGETLVFEETVTLPNDITRTFETIKVPLHRPDGEIYALLGTARDITRLKETELAFRQSEQRYHQILETAQEGICFLDPQNCYTYVNQRLGDSLGYTAEEMLGKSPLAFIDEATQAIARQKLDQRHQGVRETLDIKFRHKDGSAVWMLIAANPLFDEAGNYQGCFGMLTDITERKQTETMLRNLVEGTAATVGEDFFPALARSLAEALDVRHVLVSRYQENQIMTLAFWSDGQLQPNLSYPATTPPCYLALEEGEYHCPSCVQQSFPDNALLTQFQAESYFSVALKSVAGETLGLICVAHDQPLPQEQYQQYRGILDIFATRAAAELERQKVTVTLEEKTQEQAALLQAIPDLIIRFSQDGRYLDYQTSDPSLLYKSPEEFLGKYLDEVIPQKAAKTILDAIAQLQQTQSLTVCQYELPTGERVSYREARLVPFQSDQVIAIIRDISSRKQAEEEVRQTRNFLQMVVDYLPVAVFVKNGRPEHFGELQLWNKTCETLFGMKAQDVLGTTAYEQLPPKQAEFFDQKDQEAFAVGELIDIPEEPIDSHSLGRRLLHTVKVPIFDEQQQPEYLLYFSEDITERKAVEHALRRSEERFRASVENLLDGFAIFATVRDETGEIVDFRYEYINEAGCQLVQRPRSEILGNTMCSLLPNHRETELFEEYVQVVETGEPLIKEMFEYEDYYGGQYLRRAFSFQAMKLGNGFVVTWRDVTAQKQAKVALEASEARLKYLLSASPTPIYCSQITGNWDITYVSQNVEELFGYAATEFLQPSFWIERVHPDEVESTLAGLAQVYIQEVTSLEYRFLHQKGEYRWVRDDLKIVHSPQGEPLECVGCWLDITEQKEAQEQLQVSLQEKEVLLKEIHHRVKNNLQIIQSLLRLQSSYVEDPEMLQLFRDSQNRIRSMALVHEHLYRSEDLAQIDFADYIQSLAQSLFRAYNSSSQIHLELNLVSAQINIDTALPCGLIINELVSNALKYAFRDDRAGIIEITLQIDSTSQFILTVADNGVGLPEQISPKTTDSLGLQLVSDCTRQLEGKLQFEGSGGTKFIISFYEV
jgi:PAS domain S-box-containing protein